MKEYDISLIFITSSSIRKDQLTELFVKKDLQLSSRETDTGLLWRLEALSDKNESLSDQIKFITSVTSHSLLADNKELFRDIYLDIAVFYDTYTCSVNLSGDCLRLISELWPEIDMEITSYPVGEREEESG